MRKTDRASWPWRLVAVMILITGGLMPAPGMISAMVARPDPLALAEWLVTWVAIVGILGFGFGFRLGPLLFWRVFALPFVLYTMAGVGRLAATVAGGVAGTAAIAPAELWSAALAVPLLVFVAVGLLRYAGLLGAAPDEARSGRGVARIFA